jgi:hypothetical protein
MPIVKSKLLIPVLGVCFTLHAAAQAVSSLRMETKIDGKATYSEKPSKEKTQTRKLTIEVSNTADKPVAATTVRWAIYGHTMNGNKLVVIKEGKQEVTVPARGKTTVSSPLVKITGNREETVAVKAPTKKKGNAKDKNKVTYKKIPAAGHDYYGYGVEVVAEGKVVVSEYSKPSIGADMGPGR